MNPTTKTHNITATVVYDEQGPGKDFPTYGNNLVDIANDTIDFFNAHPNDIAETFDGYTFTRTADGGATVTITGELLGIDEDGEPSPDVDPVSVEVLITAEPKE